MNDLNFNCTKQAAIRFAIFLLIYETTVYIANDMIMPGMLNVARSFHSSDSLISSALTTFILGGASLQLFLGPISDRIGRRPVLLFGAAFFLISTILLGVSQTAHEFLIARFFQGMGLCFITVVGYAALQEIFAEISAVRLVAVLNSVTILAPLLGPLLGALIIQYYHWRVVFLVIAIFAIIALTGLWFFMPETIGVEKSDGSYNVSTPLEGLVIKHNYLSLLKNSRFILGSIAVAIATVPIIGWIGTSPLILMKSANMNALHYALWQIPIFISAIIGNVCVRYYVNYRSLPYITKIGSFVLVGGLMITAPLAYLFKFHYITIIAGMSVYAFGLSYVTTALNRLTLYSTSVPKGTASALMSVFLMLITALGNYLSGIIYASGGNYYFSLFCTVCGLLYLIAYFGCEYCRLKTLNKSLNFSFVTLTS